MKCEKETKMQAESDSEIADADKYFGRGKDSREEAIKWVRASANFQSCRGFR